jgi:hypothetical protein
MRSLSYKEIEMQGEGQSAATQASFEYGTESTGRARPISPITTKQPQATKIGIEDVTSPKVAINGAESEDVRPIAMSKPLPKPRFSTSSEVGVYLSHEDC